MDQREKTRTREGPLTQMINFAVGADQYGVDIRSVREVIQVGEVTPLPRAPSFVKGVINLRGDVIPVMDLREKLRIAAESGADAPTPPDGAALTMLVVVELGEKLVGMVVDSVSRVVRVETGMLEQAPLWLGGLSGEALAGVVRLSDRLIVVLNIEAVLSSGEKQELAALEVQEA